MCAATTARAAGRPRDPALGRAILAAAERQLGELESVVGSVAGSTYLAEAYTGWPSR